MKLSSGSGIRDPQFEVLQIEIMRTDCDVSVNERHVRLLAAEKKAGAAGGYTYIYIYIYIYVYTHTYIMGTRPRKGSG